MDQEARQRYKQLMNSDIGRRVLLASWKGALEDVYGDLINELQLKPEKANEFYRAFLPRYDIDAPADREAMQRYESDREAMS